MSDENEVYPNDDEKKNEILINSGNSNVKIKSTDKNQNLSVNQKEIETQNVHKKDPDVEKCEICGQFLNNSDILYYQGHPQNAVEEFIALTNEKLLLISG